MTTKNLRLAVPLEDGLVVEAVAYGSGTLCLSSQAGCAMACRFCASGRRGLRRNLTLAELELQIAAAQDRGFTPKRFTLSGIGEPLQNRKTVRDFLDQQVRSGLPVSLTTTGQPLAGLQEFLHLPHNGLMLSLHAGTAGTHRRLLPRGPSLHALLDLLAARWQGLSRRRRRKIGVNYLLLAGENDSEAEFDHLTAQLAPFPELTLHLLTCNAVPGSRYHSPPPQKVAQLAGRLRRLGLHVRQANRWRRQQEGGCGTLALRDGAS